MSVNDYQRSNLSIFLTELRLAVMLCASGAVLGTAAYGVFAFVNPYFGRF